MNNILIIGGSGYLGQHLARHLQSSGYRVLISSRMPSRAKAVLGNQYDYLSWDGASPDQLAPHLAKINIIVNLSGENIGEKRWTRAVKRRLHDSRVVTGRSLAAAIMLSGTKPQLLLQGSATGIYGPQTGPEVTERHAPGSGYLADLTRQWEASVSGLENSGIRIIYLRTAPVLGKGSSFIEKMSMPFRFGAGVIPGRSGQIIPWIHLHDVTASIRFLIENPSACGPFNLTAPHPATLGNLVRAMGKIYKRPVLFNLPPLALKLAFGQIADDTILASQDIRPEALIQSGYSFHYGHLEKALQNVLIE